MNILCNCRRASFANSIHKLFSEAVNLFKKHTVIIAISKLCGYEACTLLFANFGYILQKDIPNWVPADLHFRYPATVDVLRAFGGVMLIKVSLLLGPVLEIQLWH